MKYSTAVDRLRACSADLGHLSGLGEKPVLEEAWVFGELLDAPDQLDVISLALVVDLPAEEVTWLARPPAAEVVMSFLRFEKYPLRWFWRPAVWPVWNHAVRRAVRFWSRTGGSDEAVLEALDQRTLDGLTIAAPPDDETLVAQLRIENAAGRAHLRRVVEDYHDREWRREHKGSGVYPDDHLWWAAKGFLELEAALHQSS